jgi:putative ABC transport system permease protein
MKRSLRSWLWGVPLDQEVDEELSLHIELRTRELVERGMDPRAARDLVLSRIGDLGQLKRTCIDLGRKRDREMRLTRFVDELRQDVTGALRQMRAAPGFTAVVTLTLALGIGANSAIFALADAVLLRPLPYANGDRLVFIDEHGPQQGGRSRIELLNFDEWTAQNRTFETMAAIWIPAAGGGPTLKGTDGTPEMISSQIVTPQYFDVFGVSPILGRTFRADDPTSQPDAVVLSESFWRRRFASDPTIIGRAISFEEGNALTVIGIVPAEFQFRPAIFRGDDVTAKPVSMWALLPRPRQSAEGAVRGQCGVCRLLQVVGRLKPAMSIDAARADLTGLAETLAARTGARSPRRLTMTPMHELLIGRELRLTSILFLGVVGFVLLLCCANVANLVLARAAGRTRELAVRATLGAGRRRIVTQLLTESLVLAAAGGVLGLGLGAAILSAAPSLLPAELLPSVIEFGVDGRVVAFCVVMTGLSGVLFGLAPAWQATGVSLLQAITSEGRTATGRGGRFRRVVAAAEVAAAVLVLCGAGLLLRTLLAIDNTDQGYRAEGERVLTLDLTLPGNRYATPDSLRQFFDGIEREVGALAGVRSVGWATTLPLGGSQLGGQSFEILGDPPARDGNRSSADFQIVSHTYFRTLDLPIVAGRAFTAEDHADGPPVCIVSEGFVRRYLAGRNPLGLRVRLNTARDQAMGREIVGVARQVKDRPDETEDVAQIYVPNRQIPYAEGYLLVRATGDADALTPDIRRAIARVDTQLAVGTIVTLEGIARQATGRHRFRAMLVMTFAALALVLAMVGVFGVLAYSVQQRVREFGVRIALGATTPDVLRLVLGSAGRLVSAGAAIGLGLALIFAQALSTFLFGVPPRDPVTFASVTIVLAITAAIACAIPAFRAARVDPAVTFRSE